MIRILGASMCAVCSLIAVPTSAATIVQNVPRVSGPGFVNPFDTRLGTLTRVTVESSYYYNIFLTYPTMGTDPIPAVSAAGRLGTNTSGYYDFTGVYTPNRYSPLAISLSLIGTALLIKTDDFSDFTGTDRVFLAGILQSDATFTANGRELNQAPVFLPNQAGGSFRVTYDYDVAPFIPEPATWALMMTGFAMTGYVMRRRQARVAYG